MEKFCTTQGPALFVLTDGGRFEQLPGTQLFSGDSCQRILEVYAAQVTQGKRLCLSQTVPLSGSQPARLFFDIGTSARGREHALEVARFIQKSLKTHFQTDLQCSVASSIRDRSGPGVHVVFYQKYVDLTQFIHCQCYIQWKLKSNPLLHGAEVKSQVQKGTASLRPLRSHQLYPCPICKGRFDPPCRRCLFGVVLDSVEETYQLTGLLDQDGKQEDAPPDFLSQLRVTEISLPIGASTCSDFQVPDNVDLLSLGAKKKEVNYLKPSQRFLPGLPRVPPSKHGGVNLYNRCQVKVSLDQVVKEYETVRQMFLKVKPLIKMAFPWIPNDCYDDVRVNIQVSSTEERDRIYKRPVTQWTHKYITVLLTHCQSHLKTRYYCICTKQVHPTERIVFTFQYRRTRDIDDMHVSFFCYGCHREQKVHYVPSELGPREAQVLFPHKVRNTEEERKQREAASSSATEVRSLSTFLAAKLQNWHNK